MGALDSFEGWIGEAGAEDRRAVLLRDSRLAPGDLQQDDPAVRPSSFRCRRILGIDFFVGSVAEAIARLRHGGLVVVPAAPGLKNLPCDTDYREALLGADLAITDSAFMVMLWNLLERDSVPRISGLEYLRNLLHEPEVRAPHGTFWVMASESSARKNLAWLEGEGIQVAPEDVYIAPRYGDKVEDPELLARLQERRPRHVIVTVGGGVQEILGLYLKRRLTYLPAIHCIGAAIAFLSGDQVHIPRWADRLGLGWLFRTVWRPNQYLPRYWDARKLAPLMLRFRDRLPVE